MFGVYTQYFYFIFFISSYSWRLNLQLKINIYNLKLKYHILEKKKDKPNEWKQHKQSWQWWIAPYDCTLYGLNGLSLTNILTSLCPFHRYPETLKRKKMGTIFIRSAATLFFALLLISSGYSFYLPGVAPRDFQTVCSESILTCISCCFYLLIDVLIYISSS